MATIPCRALVAGFGVPAQRDLDFGRQVVRYLEPFRWPDGVVVEDLSYSAPLVLHRLHELRPPKFVLVAAVARGEGPPGTVRRTRIDPRPPRPEAVHQGLVDSVSGSADLDHTLAVLRHWGGLPVHSVLIEVEPADCSFGLGFSEELGPTLERIVAMVQAELGDCGQQLTVSISDTELDRPVAARPPVRLHVSGRRDDESDAGGIATLVDYAGRHEHGRLSDRDRGGPQSAGPPGVEVVGRCLPWGVWAQSGGDWYDVIPLDSGLVGVVVGDAPGRGAQAAALKSDLRMAAQAYALLEGDDPARMVSCLDRLVTATGRGQTTTLAYLTVQPDTGAIRMCTAGLCPPLLVDARDTGCGASLLHQGLTPPLGAAGTSERAEITTALAPGATLLVYTDGLVRKPGLAGLVAAATDGPDSLEALCEYVLHIAVDRRRREDDVCLLGLRLAR